MTEPIPTHIKGFDNLVGGGIRPGKCILLITAPILEAKLFLLEYIYKGIKSGGQGLYITTDNSPAELDSRAQECGWGLSLKEEEIKQLRWVDSYSHNITEKIEDTEVVKRIRGGASLLGDFSLAIRSATSEFFVENRPSHFVFDSISPLIINQGSKATYQFLRQTVSRLRTSNSSGFFVMGLGVHPSEVDMMIRHSMDACIEVNEKQHMRILCPINPGVRGVGLLRTTKEGSEVLSAKQIQRIKRIRELQRHKHGTVPSSPQPILHPYQFLNKGKII